MLKVILVDDEEPVLDELSYILGKLDRVEILGCYTNPVEALEHIRRSEANLVFLDIKMPQISGLCVAQEIIAFEKNIGIIFVTAHDEYAVKAFEINAIDYVMKPVSIERLNGCIDRVLNRKGFGGSVNSEALEKIQNFGEGAFPSRNKIVVWQEDEIILLKPSDVLYLAAEQGNTVIVAVDGRYISKDPLDAWERKLKYLRFFRCHRAFIVNMNRIEKITTWFGGTYNIHLEATSVTIPVSKRNVKGLKKAIGLY